MSEVERRGPRAAQEIIDNWLPHAVRATVLTAIGAVFDTGDGDTGPAIMLGWANRPARTLVVPPIIVFDPSAELVTMLEGSLRMAYDAEDDLAAEGIAPTVKAAQVRSQVVVCSGSCGRRIFGERADVGFCEACAPQFDS